MVQALCECWLVSGGPGSGELGATEVAVGYARRLFLTPGSTGVHLAVQALRGSLPESTVTAVTTAYVREVLDQIRG